MALIVLLVALACLIVGLVLTSSAWLIGSLVASAVAGLVLLRERAQRARAPRGRAARTPRPDRAAPLGAAPSGTAHADTTGADTTGADVWVIDGRPRYHREACLILKGQHAEPIPRAQADEDGLIPCSMCEPDRP
jgi:hypothetical protein